MDSKNKKILITIWTLTLMITLIGATFAYFAAISKTSPQIIITKSLNLSIVVNGNPSVNKIKPTDWSNNIEENNNNNDIVKIPFNVMSTSCISGIYKIKMSTNIKENDLLTGGDVTDIKYKLYKNNTEVKSGNFDRGDFVEELANGEILETCNLNDSYNLYIYIENKNEGQNSLQNISFDVNILGEASQTM